MLTCVWLFRSKFQSTLPCGERHCLSLAGRTIWSGFNPRSRAGSDPNQKHNNQNPPLVSIHAPVRGATRNLSFTCHTTRDVSIHAPVRGATVASVEDVCNTSVSIHAPVRGATLMPPGLVPNSILGFNPRSRAGSDLRFAVITFGFARFNPRSRAGSDAS